MQEVIGQEDQQTRTFQESIGKDWHKDCQLMALTHPKISWDSSGKYFIVFYLNQKRYRLSNGTRLGVNLHPNRSPIEQREQVAEELRLKIHLKLLEGWKDGMIEKDDRLLMALDQFRVNSNFIVGYQKAVLKTKSQFSSHLMRSGFESIKLSQLTAFHCQGYLDQFDEAPSTYNHERKQLSVILTSLMRPVGLESPVSRTKKLKEKSTLHKPFNDVHAVLEEISIL
jgi:hypothetical protein